MSNGKMERIRRCAYIIILSTMFFSIHADVPSVEALDAAHSGLPSMLNAINKPELSAQFNFSAGEEITTCTLGSPFFLRTMTPASLETYAPGKDIMTLVSPTGTWLFPVCYQGEIRLFLKVSKSKTDGVWRAVSIGSAPVASRMNKVLTKWSPEKGYHPLLVQIFETQEYFFIVPEAGSNNFTPVFPRKKANTVQGAESRQIPIDQNPYSELSDASDIVDGLLVDVRKAIPQHKK